MTSKQIDLCKVIDNVTDLSDDEKEELKLWLRENNEREIKILVMGRTGVGKSTLINAVIGEEVAIVGSEQRAETSNVSSYDIVVNERIHVIVWDSPGLLDGSGKEDEYLQEIQEKCSDVDIFIYCIKLDTRAALKEDQRDFIAIQKLTTAFKAEWWKNALFVMTFSNHCQSILEEKHNDQANVVHKQFQELMNKWKSNIYHALISVGVPKEIASNVPVEPAGHVNKQSLPGCKYWLSSLWHRIVYCTKKRAQISLILANSHRYTEERNVNDADFERPGHQQPIIIEANIEANALKLGAILAAKGAAIGLIVGVEAGAAMGFGVGAPVGAVAGASLGVAVALLVYIYKKNKQKRREKTSVR